MRGPHDHSPISNARNPTPWSLLPRPFSPFLPLKTAYPPPPLPVEIIFRSFYSL